MMFLERVKFLNTLAIAVAVIIFGMLSVVNSSGQKLQQFESLITDGDPDLDPPLSALGDPPIPADNPQTSAKVELGKKLFFDPKLSGNGSMPCSACHFPDVGWDVEAKVSFGYPGTTHWRNSQTIVNSAYYGKLFWAGSSRSLESQAKSAATGAVAGNGESDMMEARLAFVPEYREAFKEIFGDEWPKNWKCLACYRSI